MPFTKDDPNINREGRPKRKTLTELIHAKLDDTPEGWERLVALVLSKMFTDKDKDLIKELWHYTDGMPKQKIELENSIEQIKTTKEYVDKQIQSVDGDISQGQIGTAVPNDTGTTENL